MRLSGILAAGALAAAAATPLSANPLSRILADSGLTPQDTNLMRGAEQTLLSALDAGGAARASWENPESGAQGEVRIGGKQGGCLVLQHQAHLEGQADPRRLDRKFCPSDDGWHLSP